MTPQHWFLVLLIAMSTSTPTLAAPSAPADAPPAGDRPCQADAMKYCGDHRGDRAAMRSCMRENQASFSQQCRDAMQARMQARMQGQQEPGKGQSPQGQTDRPASGPGRDDS